MRITLIRHGKPHVTYNGLFTWQEFNKWLLQYEVASLKEKPDPLSHSKEVIFTSTLCRAIETAEGLYPQGKIQTLSCFNSIPVAVIPIPDVRWPLKRWISLGRCLYQLSWPTSEEWIWDTRRRASKSAAFLEAHARESEEAILVGHGCMNALIAKCLLRKGWTGSPPQKTDYLGSLVLEYLP